VGVEQENARPADWFMATALALRDRIVDRWVATDSRARGARRVYYLSIEYLIGRLLFDALNNMDMVAPARAALASLDVDLDEIRKLEPDAALGSGGLGRLAACFMDSMATLGIPAFGYGIRYDHGLFRQQIREGWQHELPEDWLSLGNPWEFERRGETYPVRFGGAVEYLGGDAETARALWYPAEVVNAVAYDTPIVGWQGRHVNTLRLWSARATEPLHLYAFNHGDYLGAVAARANAEAISRVLYPATDTPAGVELRLRQEYFFTSASLQDLVRRHMSEHGRIDTLADCASVQMNDTHPALAVAEMMRLLVDEHDVSWSAAWQMTTAILNYTNHTLLPEAIETWPVDLMNRLLPRHMQIIYLINWLHLQHIAERGGPIVERLGDLSLIHEHGERRVRMGHLAFLGSRRINGVSALHTELMRRSVFASLDAAYPGRIVNKTNGVAFRRWLLAGNPRLAAILVDAAGPRLRDEPELLRSLERLADDRTFQERIARARHANKLPLCETIHAQTGVRPDPAAMFDIHIKRIHEYKRQFLNLLETVALFQAIHDNPHGDWAPRVKIFAGKAAMSYAQAKLIIKLASDIAAVINHDKVVGDRLKVAFLPNYGVSLAEMIVPAADLSEQISTAGFEASGTGNMKLALNGALTIGTLDGANVEIRDNVGADNIFIFGLQADEVVDSHRRGFSGRDALASSPRLGRVVRSLADGTFSPDDRGRYRSTVDRLLGSDPFMVAADFESYWAAQRRVDMCWNDPARWQRMSLLNTARMGWFSSDRAIREYAEDIWQVPVNRPGATR
jgi:starch phosphorylase